MVPSYEIKSLSHFMCKIDIFFLVPKYELVMDIVKEFYL